MSETEQYLRMLLQQKGIVIDKHFEALFSAFAGNDENILNVKQIRTLQETMIKNWQLQARKEDINHIHFAFPNGIAGKQYTADFELSRYGLDDLGSFSFSGLDGSGLVYNTQSNRIEGIPINSGDISLIFTYSFNGAEADKFDKRITIIINPDPKSLWKDLPSDVNDPYFKKENSNESALFLANTLIASSKRGRSHANKGTFREDDYAYATLQNGWGVIAIADGAGSATYARKGSNLACNAIINYFKTNLSAENSTLLDQAIAIYQDDDSIKEKLLDIAFTHLSAAAHEAHTAIADFATTNTASLADFHATLSFVLVKKFPAGHAFLSFAVGDCPIVLLDKSFGWVKPLNTLDAGDYGGGTRFITMPSIFNNENFRERFNFAFTAEFPYLILMTDGIYDPKFEVEANLSNLDKWKLFFDDLQGNNEEGINVLLATEKEKDRQLARWMDFWSTGNHDDRTLIILF